MQGHSLSTAPRPGDEAKWIWVVGVRGGCARHLGVQLGGAALSEVWAAPVAKWLARVAEAAREAPPAVAMAVRYTTRIVPVLGYMATMLAPIADLARIDRDAVCCMLWLPGSSMPYRGVAELAAEWGFQKFPDAEVYCRTALAVTAAQTEPKWHPLCCALLGPGTESDRPLAPWAARYDVRQVGVPIATQLADALSPLRGAGRVVAVVAELMGQQGSRATRKKVQKLATQAVSPRWVAAAVQKRLAKVLLGDGSEPEPAPDAAQVECLRWHAPRLSPQWGGPR